jgi:hypothetical protein
MRRDAAFPWTLRGAIWACVVAGFIGLFLPWAHLELIRETALEKQISASVRKATKGSFNPRKRPASWPGAKPGATKAVLLPTRLTGAQIPVYANSRNAKVALALAKRFGHAQGPIGAQSYAVYALPGLIVLCAILLAACERHWAVGAAVAAACLAIAVAGFGWLALNDTRKLYTVAVGPGIWISLAAYAVLGAAAATQCWRCQTAPWRGGRRAK